jgi:hypothetical protein
MTYINLCRYAEDARFTAEAAEHAKSAAWIPAGHSAAAAAARLRAHDRGMGAYTSPEVGRCKFKLCGPIA